MSHFMYIVNWDITGMSLPNCSIVLNSYWGFYQQAGKLQYRAVTTLLQSPANLTGRNTAYTEDTY